MSERQSDSSREESQQYILVAESSGNEGSSSNEDYGIVDMHPNGNDPYQDEPLAIPGG